MGVEIRATPRQWGEVLGHITDYDLQLKINKQLWNKLSLVNSKFWVEYLFQPDLNDREARLVMEAMEKGRKQYL